jgi:uncharacterized membrane protein
MPIMLLRRPSTVAFALLCLTLLGSMAYYLPALPDRLATHFDAENQANGWSSKAEFITIHAIVVLVCGAIFLGAGALLRLPDHMISLPSKSYWLAVQRRDETLTYLRGWLCWIVVLVLALVTTLSAIGLRANQSTPPQLPGYFLFVMIAYFLVLAAMIAALVRRFRVLA